MPFEMDLNNKKEEDNDELFREDSAGAVENNSKKKDQKFSDVQTGDFQELAPDIEIKPEAPAYPESALMQPGPRALPADHGQSSYRL